MAPVRRLLRSGSGDLGGEPGLAGLGDSAVGRARMEKASLGLPGRLCRVSSFLGHAGGPLSLSRVAAYRGTTVFRRGSRGSAMDAGRLAHPGIGGVELGFKYRPLIRRLDGLAEPPYAAEHAARADL